MKILVAAALGFAIALPAAALAAPSSDAWYALSAQTGDRVTDATRPVQAGHRPGFTPMPANVRPDAGTPSFFANFIATGLNAANVPCFDCIDGNPGTPGTFGLPAPYNVVAANSYWQYNLSWSNLSFAGTCTVSYAVTNGKTVVQTQSTKVPGISGAGAFDWAWVGNPVTYTGPAVVTGKVVCGGKKSSVTAKMIFQ